MASFESEKDIRERTWPRRMAASLGSVVLLVGGTVACKEVLDTTPRCGDSIVLDNSDPESYITIGNETFALDIENLVGDVAVTVRKGSGFYEQEKSRPTIIPLSIDRKGKSYSGSAVIPEVGETLSVSVDADVTKAHTFCG